MAKMYHNYLTLIALLLPCVAILPLKQTEPVTPVSFAHYKFDVIAIKSMTKEFGKTHGELGRKLKMTESKLKKIKTTE